jgi:ATP-binding protein involved in chromosome partitioning
MSAFVAPDGTEYPLFGEGGGAALAETSGAPLVAQIPLESGLAAGGDAGHPVAEGEPESPAGAAFHALAARLATELLPPVEMAGCTARIFELVNAARPS